MSINKKIKKIRKMMPTKSWCPQMLTGISIQKEGLAPCCEYTGKLIPVTTVEDYKSHPVYKNWIDQMEQGIWVPGCRVCKEKEQNGFYSQRLSEVENQHPNFETADNLDIFYDISKNNEFLWINFQPTNLCNQACIMCNPRDSSKLEKEVNENSTNHWHGIYDRSNLLPQPDLSIYKLHEQGRIYLSGGEPSIMKNVFKYLEEEIAAGKKLQVEMNSNFNSFNLKFWEIMKGVDNLGVLASIDDIGNRAEYIRYGCRWNEVYNNIKKLKEMCNNAHLRLTPTWGMYNIFYIDEYINWAVDNNLEILWNGIISEPVEFSLNYLHPAFHTAIIEKIENSRYKEIPNVELDRLEHFKNMIENSTFDINVFEKTKSTLNKIDNLRKLNYKKTFPELANYISTVDDLLYN